MNAPKNEMPFEMRSCQAKGVAAYLPLQIQLRQHKVSVGSVCCELVSKLAARSCRLFTKRNLTLVLIRALAFVYC